MTGSKEIVSLHILLADDDELDRIAVHRALRTMQFEVEIDDVTSGYEALVALRKRPYDCVLMDYQLPDADGVTLLHQIQAEGLDSPIVMLTGHGDERVAVEIMKAGAVDYLTKSSMTPGALALCLRTAVRVHQAEVQERLAEERLRASEQYFRTMADTAPAFLWMSDEEGRCTFFNQSWLRFTGRTLDQELGDGWEAGIHPDDRSHCRQIFASALLAQADFRMEYRLRRHDGEYRWVLDSGAARSLPNGTFAGYIGSCIDITDRKEAEQALLDKQVQIETLNQRLKRAMEETHHRIKNNLQTVVGMLDMRAMDHPVSVPTGDLKQLTVHVQVLAAVHEILTEQARMDGLASHVSARSTLERLLALLQQMEKNRTLRYKLEEAWMTANQSSSLAVVVNELVNNAARYGRQRIDVTMRQDGGGTAVVEVADDGPGFPPGFDSIKSVHTGLDLVQHLVRWDLQGSICFENRPEGGALVRVIVPLSSDLVD